MFTGRKKGIKECPFCGAEVSRNNFNHHLLKVHADRSTEDFAEKGIEKPTSPVPDRKMEEKKEEIRRSVQKRMRNRRVGIAAAAVSISIVLILVGVVMYQKYTDSGTGNNGGSVTTNNPTAVLRITMGTTTDRTIKIELYTKNAPVTAGNFINLIKSGFYNGVTFHRAEPGFVIQGGGYTSDGKPKSAASIPWENTGLKNMRWTISMARSGDPNSPDSSGTATSQFFINLQDNPSLDSYKYPYVVFGRVIEGFEAVEAIAAMPTYSDGGIRIIQDPQPVITSATINY